MGSLPSFNCGDKYFICVIDVFTKYAWFKPFADEKAKTTFDGFIGIANVSGC